MPGSSTTLLAGLAAGLSLAASSPAIAETQPPPDPIDPSELELIVDSSMAEQMTALEVPGAVVAIVQGGDILLAKGYGHADVENAVPADASTPFRVASLSKVLTATAALRLARQGRLDLAADVESYLPFSLSRGFEDPITMHHLLTHTSGYETTDISDAARTVEEVLPLETLVRDHMVGQSHAPGTLYSYSNHGYSLAGLVVEIITGRKYAEAMRDLVLRPVGMDRSSFAQPLPPHIGESISKSYGDEMQPLQRDFTQIAPADGLVTTAEDMAKFMISQLQGLPEWETGLMETMQSQQYAPYPTRYGMAYAWHEDTHRGLRALEHSGGQLGFASYMVIIPELEFGYFIAQNRREGRLRNVPLNAILEEYFPRVVHELPDATQPPRDISTLVSEYVGYYISADYPRHSFERLLFELSILGRDVVVNEPPPCAEGEDCRPDNLAINSSEDRYYEVAPDIFQHPTAWWATAAFFRDDNGDIAGLYLDKMAYEKRPAWRLPALQMVFVLVTFLLSIPAAVVWPVVGMKRSASRSSLAPLQRLVSTCAFVGLLTLALLGLVLRVYAFEEVQMDYGIRTIAWLFLCAADLMKIAVVVMILAVSYGIARRNWSAFKSGYLVVLSVALLHSAWLFHVSNVSLIGVLGA
jgi:CubicO group peptidase (beta-lactamase class C family)